MLLIASQLSAPAVPLSRVLHVAATPTPTSCIAREPGMLLVLLSVAPTLAFLALLALFIGASRSGRRSLRDLSPSARV
jgi:hypothetical protein